MSDSPKSLSINDQCGTVVTAMELPLNSTSVMLMLSDLGHRTNEHAVLYVSDAKLLGEWLIAWAKEHEEKRQ